MSPRDSERGLTLLEVAVALVVSGILLVVLVRFSRDFNRTYNNQEQVSDRDLNAHYAVKRLSEAFMAAGANLPATDWTVVALPEGNPGPRIVISVNPRGGIQYLTVSVSGASEIPVDDGKEFRNAGWVLADPMKADLATLKVGIARNYNSKGFVNGIKTTATGALLRLSTPVTLTAGDMIYAYDEEDYRLEDGNLVLNGNVLAENIQKLGFSALTADLAPTAQWSAMRSGKIQVTARTRAADPNYNQNGGYRALDLTMDVLLRNRL